VSAADENPPEALAGAAGAAAGAGTAAFAGGGAAASGAAPANRSMICASVRVAAIFAFGTCGRLATFCFIADRISTRLIESIPRSASMSMFTSIISAG
jgi:hypothetical protein